MTYDQINVIQQLNHYLKSQKRSMVLTHGFCHGLTLLWLHHMSFHNENWFYHTIKKIIRGPLHEDSDVEKFLNHMEWLQNPEKYVNGLRQMDMESTMEKQIELRFSGIFSIKELKRVLKMTIAENKMIVLSGSSHTIGVLQRDHIYYIYNPNAKGGIAKKVSSLRKLHAKILRYLYEFSDETDYLSLIVHVIDNQNSENPDNSAEKSTRKKLLHFIFLRKNYVDRTDDEKISPLYLATESHDADLVKKLLKKNAPPNIATLDGRLALLHASYSGYQRIAKYLLEYGAEPDMEGREGTPLFVASFYGHVKVVKTLLNFGADVNKADRDGETAIFAAIENNHPEIIQLLLANHANIHHRRKNGETPIDVALKANNENILTLLTKKNYSQQFFAEASEDKKFTKPDVNNRRPAIYSRDPER